jgi:hypothetical protein
MRRSLFCCAAVAIGVGGALAAPYTHEELERAHETLRSLGSHPDKLGLFCEAERLFKDRSQSSSEQFKALYVKSPPDLKNVFDIQDVLPTTGMRQTPLERKVLAAEKAAKRMCR